MFFQQPLFEAMVVKFILLIK